MEIIARGGFALAMFGPTAVGLAVPILSAVWFQRRGRKPRAWVVVAALVVWLVLAIGVTLVFQGIYIGYAYRWDHRPRDFTASEVAQFFGWIGAGFLLLAGCGWGLHRLLANTSNNS